RSHRVTTTWHLLTGEYPPASGGVGDYTAALASELARRGHAVHVWSPSVPPDTPDGEVHFHALPDRFGSRSRRALQSIWGSSPGIVLLQYVPNALGAGGLNLPFCRWLQRAAGRSDVRVMFHEPYFYFSWNPAGNVRAIVQRLMAGMLVGASRTVYVSTETWRRYLPQSSRLTVLPVPSTIPRGCDADAAARFRARIAPAPGAAVVGHFGTYGDHVGGALEPVVPLVLDRSSAQFVCIGRGGDRFAAALRARHPAFAGRIHHTGALASSDVAAAIRACDVMLQPYPDGITTRRTSVMAALTNGVATVSTDGALTEAVWRSSGAVALAPANDARAIATTAIGLLGDSTARAELAAAGRRAYDAHFAIENSVDTLLRQP
ncbi:MAG TPA: glycosyltransferase family 4 protein, partial [Gemmatimonadaceae bacterium]|nr:glycosyltransferase family 4 protein [Gemmatimonadaceae bacterium]